MSYKDSSEGPSAFVPTPNGAYKRGLQTMAHYDAMSYRRDYGPDALMHVMDCRTHACGGPKAQEAFRKSMKALSASLPLRVWGSPHNAINNGGPGPKTTNHRGASNK